MLKIRKEQFDQYLQSNEQQFIQTILDFVRQDNPELIEGLPEHVLSEMVANGIERARSHGFRSDEDLMAFVAVMFEISPNFDEQPQIYQALHNPALPLDQRFDAIFDGVPAEAWQEAELNIDADAWFPELRPKAGGG